MIKTVYKYKLPDPGEAEILPFDKSHPLFHFAPDGEGTPCVWASPQDGFGARCVVSCFGTGWPIPDDGAGICGHDRNAGWVCLALFPIMSPDMLARLAAHAAQLRDLAARYSWRGNAKYPTTYPGAMRATIEQQAADIEAAIAELSK